MVEFDVFEVDGVGDDFFAFLNGFTSDDRAGINVGGRFGGGVSSVASSLFMAMLQLRI